MAGNIIMFKPIMDSMAIKSNTVFVMFIDAQASPQVLVSKRPSSKAMQAVLRRIHALPAYVQYSGMLAVIHLFSEGNVASDCASRGMFEELEQYCAQMGIHPEQCAVTPEMYALVRDVLNEILD